jgi:16S rRNA (guanine527-N7)-methyltransferase
METTRIAELLEPFVGGTPLLPRAIEQLSQYLDLLLRWNAKTNLTAVRDGDSIVQRHFGESLFAAGHLFPPEPGPQPGNTVPHNQALSVVDVGSGAGFPGVPLKIYAPGISLTLIESQNKKATFLKEVARALQLDRVSVFNDRAEQYPGKTDLVTLRAVEQFENVLPVAASLVRAGGRLALLIGDTQVTRAQELLTSIVWDAPVAIPQSSARVLLVGRCQAASGL